MPISFAAYSGKSNTGLHTNINEDYILFNEFDNNMLFAAVADGSGSKTGMFSPASIVTNQVDKVLHRLYKKNPDLLKNNAKLFMEEAFQSANNILIGFKIGNEEKYFGFASTLTCMLLDSDGNVTVGHVGNTRLYLLRDGRAIQLTKDHTEGQKLVERGMISPDDYYTAIERLTLYNGMGITPEPEVQTFQTKLKENDVIIMTSDGIHYSYKSDAFFDILLQSETVDEASDTMINTALELKNYIDNLSANIIWYLGKEKNDNEKQT